MTNTYNTGNPLGSTNPRDLYDNASNFDEAMNANAPAFIDRFGKRRETWEGLQQLVKNYLASQGYSYIGEYAAGLTFVGRNQYMVRDGVAYRPTLEVALPFTTTGTWATDAGNFLALDTDTLLRSDLAADGGASLIGTSSGRTVQEELDDSSTAADDYVLVDAYGAVGDGITDDSLAFIAALQTGRPVRGVRGKTYGVSTTLGNLYLYSTDVRLSHAAVIDLTPDPGVTSRRVIFYNGAGVVEISHLSVNRNGDGSNGALNDAAGIWIAGTLTGGFNVSGHIRNCEVFGNGKGSGIVWIQADMDVQYNYVHDIRGGNNLHATITDDAVQGFWAFLSTGAIEHNKVRGLTTQFSGQAASGRYTRGFAFGGCSDFTVFSNWDYASDQSFDISGGPNHNTRFSISSNHALNSYTWGFKFANTAVEGEVYGNTAYRPGLAGFVASAPNSLITNGDGSPINSDYLTQNISIHDNVVYDSGKSGKWTSFSNHLGVNIGPAGIMVLASAVYPEFPRGISIHDNHIIAPASLMRYGVTNDVTVPATGTAWNQARNNSITGFFTGATYGNNYGLATRSTGTTQGLAAGNTVNVSFTNTFADAANMGNGSSGLLIRRAGVYRVNATVQYDSAATGLCLQTILINGNPVSESIGQSQYTAPRRAEVSLEMYLAAGTSVGLRVNSSVSANLLAAQITASESQCV